MPPLVAGEASDQLELYHQLVLDLDGFSDALMGNLPKFVGVGDDSVWAVWTCCVTCLGHLAALCHLIGRMEPTSRDSMDNLCGVALEKLVDLSHETRIEEYSHFDILTGVRISVVFPGGEEYTDQGC